MLAENNVTPQRQWGWKDLCHGTHPWVWLHELPRSTVISLPFCWSWPCRLTNMLDRVLMTNGRWLVCLEPHYYWNTELVRGYTTINVSYKFTSLHRVWYLCCIVWSNCQLRIKTRPMGTNSGGHQLALNKYDITGICLTRTLRRYQTSDQSSHDHSWQSSATLQNWHQHTSVHWYIVSWQYTGGQSDKWQQ